MNDKYMYERRAELFREFRKARPLLRATDRRRGGGGTQVTLCHRDILNQSNPPETVSSVSSILGRRLKEAARRKGHNLKFQRRSVMTFPDANLVARLSEYRRREGEQAETFAELKRRANSRATPDLQGGKIRMVYPA